MSINFDIEKNISTWISKVYVISIHCKYINNLIIASSKITVNISGIGRFINGIFIRRKFCPRKICPAYIGPRTIRPL